MNRWRAIILAAVAACVLAGCGTSHPASAGQPSPAPAPAASPAAAGTTAAASADATGAVIYLTTSEQVPFAGDVVTLTTQAAAGPGSSRSLRLASVTVSFGDGSAGSSSQPCAGRPRGLIVGHAYQRAGRFTAQVTSARICGRAGRPDLTGVTAALRVLPTAPPASASWPQCRRDEVHVAARGTGAGLGHVGVLFTLRNVSRAGCRILGYAGLRLLSRAGRPLPTTVHHATSGTYLFPPVAPHWVALRPGAFAAFELEYGDTPVGAQASEPYAQACPAATQAEVTWPGARGYRVAAAAMAPCGGAVWISPVIPGREWIVFP
jgi:Protein of unknown function (DUF4232)